MLWFPLQKACDSGGIKCLDLQTCDSCSARMKLQFKQRWSTTCSYAHILIMVTLAAFFKRGAKVPRFSAQGNESSMLLLLLGTKVPRKEFGKRWICGPADVAMGKRWMWMRRTSILCSHANRPISGRLGLPLHPLVINLSQRVHSACEMWTIQKKIWVQKSVKMGRFRTTSNFDHEYLRNSSCTLKFYHKF